MKILKKDIFFKYLIFIIALILIAISINCFYAPFKVASGGATGIAILAEFTFGWPVAVTTLIVNLIMLLLSFIFLDKETTYRISLGSFLLPIILFLIPQAKLVNDKLLSIIVASSIFAVGVALLYRIDASSGGTTVPPIILKKYFNLNSSLGLIAIDLIVSLGNLFVGGIETFILALFSIILTGIIMNYIETGLDKRKMILIRSQEHIEELKQEVNNLSLGSTIIPVIGGRSRNNDDLIMIVINNYDYNKITKSILNIDSNSFITVVDVSRVSGGFLK